MYHYVRPLKNSAYPEIKGLEEKGFKNQLKYFEKKFEFGNFTEIIHSAHHDTKINNNKILLTFDDGLKDHFTTVYPILKKIISFFVVFLLFKYARTSGYLPNINSSWQKFAYFSKIVL